MDWNWRHFITQCLLFLFLVFIINRVFFYSPSAVESTSSYIVYPFLRTYQVLINPFVQWQEHRKNVKELQETISGLEAQCTVLEGENIELKVSGALYQDIAELIEFRQRYQVQDVVLGHVLIKNLQAQEHCMFINCGADKNIQSNMVAVHKNCLVGRVVEVYPWYCKILLITDQWNKIAAITERTKVKGIYEGKNSAQASLSYVQHFSLPELDELVFSTGEGLIYPQGFCLGKISEIIQGDIYHSVSITPILDFDSLEYVYIIRQQ